ncbi:MAG: polyribonucleotide nucleotidyltransferase [Candidatus Ryanbacteria bacterium RIFCSPHIGHO2_02_FULL_48_12]|uniref:Polyribonucleotide nucleotidyltransferase n=1 Tax=Candidatus Ryanbacteria bacterium RIFCSPHIGHO2_01_FULL_48_27 TaxID=1802115 RepID=A0A1G2G8L8_9BACT|nr:MAG: polyribonucleotide nucleotidyltransferase [Candidatus Ryanbacteria bacterium RIFCSPHIGHO2_01_FULL_48_27]OGZ49201.1 MAG: polyribonucleotide nucleotidyltransferase [Candidatus Ryanbacteria bacterium RIFCSPHIGHO2_02_FULL_48_12]
MEIKKYTTEFAGKPLSVEFTPLAEQANGSVIVRYGGTVVLANATMGRPREGGSFFPLTVDFEEKYYAAGKILGSRFVRREARPSEEAILVSRIIDRTIRPLFDQRIRNDVQVIVTALSVDGENDPDVPAVLAASIALATSDIPWNGPICGVRVVKKDDAYIINPSYAEREGVLLETIFCGKGGKVNMIETEAHEASERDMIAALELGLKEIEKLNTFQASVVGEIGKVKIVLDLPEISPELRALFDEHIATHLDKSMYEPDKTVWVANINALKKEWFTLVETNLPETPKSLSDEIFEDAVSDIVHKHVLEAEPGAERRPDGRGAKQIRKLFATARFLERTHGSGVFFRGQTHILSVATLGAPGDVLLIEGMSVREKRHFMHHYNFPPYSVGETGPMRGPGRREIGHGALAEKALRAMIPPKEEFPYTIRLVSETLSSNGSSSMGSVCGSSVALMDAGVPIKRHIAGISMGLMMESDTKYRILTDIQGPEDHHGDMDFKAAGTREGLTAIQMDVKVEGVTVQMLAEALEQAKDARFQILSVLESVIAEPRKELSPYAPRIITMKIDPLKIREVIGPGGKVINEIIEKTGAQIDIEQDGTIFITGTDEASAKNAVAIIDEITHEYEVGEKFEGVVTRLFNFGAMVEFAPNQEGLVHVSELAPWRVEQVTDVVDIGDKVPVQIISIDEQGRVNLSIKEVATIEPKPHAAHKERSPRAGGGEGGGHSGGHRREGGHAGGHHGRR